MKSIWIILVAHLVALAFGLGGLLIALPNPELWSGSPFAADVFTFGMRYAGSLHIVLGALTMLVFGGYFIGWSRTLIFFGVTVVLSLSSELIGTGTGWPFGNYEYTSGLGYKVLGRVPYTIPLSWFYIGFASFLLASILTGTRNLRYRAVWTVAIGAYLLTVWDLVLDPAMAHESLPLQFWVWFETGPYFGMPVKNFIGWTLTGVLFMGISRWIWRSDVGPRQFPAWIPFVVYLANMIFACALSLSVGLWEPVVIAMFLGVVPAVVAWRAQSAGPIEPPTGSGGRREERSESPVEAVARETIRAGARIINARRLNLEVRGLEHLPQSGPVLIASRHYHHLYDGSVLIASISRPAHILVALDWVEAGWMRRLMEWACRLARWPVVLRGDGLSNQVRSAFHAAEARRYLRRALRESVDLLREGCVLIVFPEAYPNVDPSYTPKQDGEFLPFRSGFARIAQLAEMDGETRVPIVPVGLAYEAGSPWQVMLRFGSPVYLDSGVDQRRAIQEIEEQVRLLSEPVPVSRPAVTQEVVQS